MPALDELKAEYAMLFPQRPGKDLWPDELLALCRMLDNRDAPRGKPTPDVALPRLLAEGESFRSRVRRLDHHPE